MSTLPPSFTCPRCTRISYNPNDVAQQYCGACHDWTGDSQMPIPAGPLDQPPAMPALSVPQRSALLRRALGDIPLGRHDELIIDWICATHDAQIIATLAGLVLRARATAPATV